MDYLFVSEIKSYRTASEKAQGMFSVGMSVASRLNGDEYMVGTFDSEDNAERKIGFITFRKKFGKNSYLHQGDNLSEEENKANEATIKEWEEKAEEFVEKMEMQFPIASKLSNRKWSWGRADDEASDYLPDDVRGNAVIHYVKYGDKTLEQNHEVIRQNAASKQGEKEKPEKDLKQMQHKGKVVEPVS